MLRKLAKNSLLELGYVVSKYDFRRDYAEVRRRFLNTHGINVIFDIGANSGQFATQMRSCGYQGRIVSFEPLSKAYRLLHQSALQDPSWDAVHCALGSANCKAEINISGNSWSSSLLDILPAHVDSAPESAYVGKEEIEVRTLDSLIDDYRSGGDRLFLKIDTQGFSQEVLNGAQRSLETVEGLQLEMSLVPLYRDEPLIGESIDFLYKKGFSLVAIEPEYYNAQTGQLLQANGLFFRM
jgi:FkbM family methyltransferase